MRDTFYNGQQQCAKAWSTRTGERKNPKSHAVIQLTPGQLAASTTSSRVQEPSSGVGCRAAVVPLPSMGPGLEPTSVLTRAPRPSRPCMRPTVAKYSSFRALYGRYGVELREPPRNTGELSWRRFVPRSSTSQVALVPWRIDVR